MCAVDVGERWSVKRCRSVGHQGRRKQSPDGQAQLDVGALLIIRARSAQQNFGLGIFSSEEALSLHFSLVILNVSLTRVRT